MSPSDELLTGVGEEEAMKNGTLLSAAKGLLCMPDGAVSPLAMLQRCLAPETASDHLPLD